MTMDHDTQPRVDAAPLAYEPPTVRPLGTLADLTLGGVTSGPADQFGFSGDDDTFGSTQ